MLATRWEPLSGMNRLHQDMNRLFQDMSSRTPRFAQASYPQLNLWEDDENFLVEAELPGLALDDLELIVTGGSQLSLKGERKQPEPENAKWHRHERGFGTFSRTVELPSPVNADEVSASFSNGVLTITLPKSEEAKPRKITVTSS